MNSLTSPLQQALGADWERLPPALQAHYSAQDSTDVGHMDIRFPPLMRPLLWLLGALGALVSRAGRQVSTRVDKRMAGPCQHWRRTLRFADGRVQRFNSVWVPSGPGRITEFVNPWLGLEMQPALVEQQLHYRGLRFVLQLGTWQLTLPQWLGPGVTHIQEEALDERCFAMDFRMIHPWFGELFSYAGVFCARVSTEELCGAGEQSAVKTQAR